MIFVGKLAIGLLDLIHSCGTLYAKRLVVVFEFHGMLSRKPAKHILAGRPDD
jgi:hypothetical protein